MRTRLLAAAAMMLVVPVVHSAGPGGTADEPSRPAPAPPAECQAFVAYDREMTLPGYRLPTSLGKATCIPFTTVAAKPPAGYMGDFYVDEFTDARLRERWAACKKDAECYARVHKQVSARKPPNREHGMTNARSIELLGKVKEEGEVDLKTIRRPAFFARAPYHESVARVEPNTWTVEFTAPPDTHDRLQRNMRDSVELRGWYVRGKGVDDGKGGRTRALVIMSGGGGARLVAIEHPSDRLYRFDPKTGRHILNDYPNETTGSPGQALWRRTLDVINEAGFDVLAFDRRGVGISSGFTDTNTLQQGRDLLAIVASLRTGDGLRALAPSGEVTKGRDAAAAVRGGAPDEGLPVLFLGSSRGTMASGWAMTMNFDKDCTYDLPDITCGPPVGDKTVKGAILIAEFSSGPGYVSSTPSVEDESRGLGRDRPLFIGGSQVELNIVFFPSSAILAGIHKWPAVFFARGLWDYAAALEGTLDSYRRVKGLKEVVVVRGPHPYETWPSVEKERVQQRFLAFARAVVLGQSAIPGGRPWSNMKELVATTEDVWEPTSEPKAAGGRP
jgi:pimeloyl-ACP methyl ester carboxylesterase